MDPCLPTHIHTQLVVLVLGKIENKLYLYVLNVRDLHLVNNTVSVRFTQLIADSPPFTCHTYGIIVKFITHTQLSFYYLNNSANTALNSSYLSGVAGYTNRRRLCCLLCARA